MTSDAANRQAPLRIHLDPVGGIAGDMFVACMLDAFPDFCESVLGHVRSVVPEVAGRPQVDLGSSGGIRALRFSVGSGPVKTEKSHDAAHGHHHHHHHNHSGDDHHHEHRHDEELPASAREAVEKSASYTDLVSLIAASSIPEDAKHHATAILTQLAKAEAHIHGVPLNEVHFHELADWDSLMDVVAAGCIIAAIGPAHWSIAPLPLGSGLVRTQHGLLPIPAPATTIILKGFSWRNDGIEGERVTPTGAAIVAHLVSVGDLDSQPGFLLRTGIGAGTRHLKGMPNILRALVFDGEVGQGPSEVMASYSMSMA